MRGMFFTFEGPEGSGKSTHIRLLYNYLKRRGLRVIKVRQPGETRIGKIIRKIILNPEYKEISPLTEMLLYMVSHSQLIKEKIIPYLKEGYIILCDRFLDSTIAYQGYGLKVNLDLIKKIANFICEGITPDLTVLLDIPVEEGLRRLKGKPDRIEQRELIFHKRLREGYLKLAKIYPQRIKVVTVDKDSKVTQRKIRELVLEKLCLLEK
jgi:dTMP kinase